MAAQAGKKETAQCFFGLARRERGGPAAAYLERLSVERSDLPWFAYYFGNLNWENFADAERLYLRAARGFQQIGDEEGEVYARINRSVALTRLGRTQEARLEAERIHEISEISMDSAVRAWGRITLARQLLDSGQDLARAYALLRDMEIPGSTEEAISLRRDWLLGLGRVCMMIGRVHEARDAFQQQVELAEAAGDPYSEAAARSSLVWVVYEMLREAPTEAKQAEAIELAKRALAVALEANHRSAETWAAWYLGALIPGEEGMRYLEHCERAAENPFMRSLCLNPIAGRLAATDPYEAQRLIETSLELAVRSGEGWAEVRVWQEAMHVAWMTEPPQRALQRSLTAIYAMETLRDRQPEGSVAQAGMFSIWSDDYAWLAGRLLEQLGKGLVQDRAVAEAFGVSERMRARALADWLRRMDPNAADASATRFRGFDEIQAALRPDEVLLSFQIAPWTDLIGNFGGGSWLLAVTRGAVTVHRLPGRVELRRNVKLFEGLIERRDGSEAGPAAHLYGKLLAPALAGLPPEVDRLILVPDDALHRLPFAALRASADAEPLGARYELVQVPSATLWLDWRRAQVSAPGRPLLVLADPELPVDDQAADPVEVKVAQVRDAAGVLGRLPHARREGRAAVRALGDGLLLIGAEASEARLGALRLRDFGLVHFAAHAVTDEDQPERSAVLLAAGGAHDGRLQSAEIAGLDLAGRTVVLASCWSASGSVLRGEGVMSLGRAFFQAGAHGVVASLWQLRDDESAALFGRFYRRLAEGATVGEALHGARREAIAAGEPAAAWAGLVVLGDGSLVPVPGGRRAGVPATWWWVAVLLIVVVGAVAGWVAIRRFRASRLVRVPGGGVRAGIDLDRPRELDVDEDEAAWSRRE